jgi:hypothetical protein
LGGVFPVDPAEAQQWELAETTGAIEDCGVLAVVHYSNNENSVVGPLVGRNLRRSGIWNRYTAGLTFRDITIENTIGSLSHGIRIDSAYNRGKAIEGGVFTNCGNALVMGGSGKDANWVVDGCTFANNLKDLVIHLNPTDALGRDNGKYTFNIRNVDPNTNIDLQYPVPRDMFITTLYGAYKRVIWDKEGTRLHLLWKFQARDYVPFPSTGLPELMDKTNLQIWEEFGVTPYGGLAPESVVDRGGYLEVAAPGGDEGFYNNPDYYTPPSGPAGQNLMVEFGFLGADQTVEVVPNPGLNIVPVTIGGVNTTLFVRGT